MAQVALAKQDHAALPEEPETRDLLVLPAPLVLTDLLVPLDLPVPPVPLVQPVQPVLPVLPVRKAMTGAEPSV